MTHRSKVDWRVPAREWRRFLSYIDDEDRNIQGYKGREVESAMEEWIGKDGGDELEELVDRLVQAAGRRPEDPEEKKSLSSTALRQQEKTRVTCHVHPTVKSAFCSFVDENMDVNYGIALGYALREYRTGGRIGRLTEKLSRVVDDAEDLLSYVDDESGDTLPKQKRQTIAICKQLGKQFSQSDLHEAIEDVTSSDSDYIYETYTEQVLKRLDYTKHPNNGTLLIPREDARQIAEDNDIPGPDAPAIDRHNTDFNDLTIAEKIEGLQLELVRRVPEGRKYGQVDTRTVKRKIFDNGPSDSQARNLMRKAASDNGFSIGTTSGGMNALRVNLHSVSRELFKNTDRDRPTGSR